jgi:hypothetical protein
VSNPVIDHHSRIAALNPITDAQAAVDPDVQRGTLARIVSAEPSPPRQRTAIRRPLTAVLAIAVVATIVGFGLHSDHPTMGLPAAATALAEQTAGPVLHTIERGTQLHDASGGPAEVSRETWELRDGSRIRTKITFADGTFQDLVLYREAGRQRVDAYWSKNHLINHGTWQPIAPSSPKQPQNIADDYQRAVTAGQARVIGEITVNGIPAYRISPIGNQLIQSVVWTIAKDPEHPRLLAQRICLRASPCLTTTYSVYESTSDTATLSMPDYPHAMTAP